MRFGWLRPWPLLLGALAAVAAGTRLLNSPDGRELAAASLLTIGAVLIGAWICLLAAHDYSGREPDDPPKDDHDGP
jgi:hypothetical protein